MGWELEFAGTISHLARTMIDPPVKHAAPSTLFSALRRPNPEDRRIWSPRCARANTTRLDWVVKGGSALRAKFNAREKEKVTSPG